MRVAAQPLDLEPDAHVVEVDVAAERDGLRHVHRAVPALLVAAEDGVVDGEVARTMEFRLRRDHALLQSGQRVEDLERRSRRVAALDGAVEERLLGVAQESAPLRGLDAERERVGIEGGRGDVGQHLARVGIDGHHGAGLPGHGVDDRLLQVEVDGEVGPRAVHRRHARGLADLHAAAVHLDAPQAVLAHEPAVVLQLHPGLAHDVARLEPLEGATLELAVRDLAHVAERMGQAHAQRIRAQGHHVHARLRLLEPARLHRRHVLFAGVRLDHHRAEARALRVEVLAHLARIERHELREPLQGTAQLVLALGGDHDVERRTVLGQDPALAVEERAAGGGNGQRTRAVVLRLIAEGLAADDLQVPEVDDQRGHGQGDHRLHRPQAALHGAEVLVDPHHVFTRAPSSGGADGRTSRTPPCPRRR